MPVEDRPPRDRKALEAWRNQPEHWKGPFYFNRADKAVFVPKRKYGEGYTLNFVRPSAYAVLLGFLLFLEAIFWLFSLAA